MKVTTLLLINLLLVNSSLLAVGSDYKNRDLPIPQRVDDLMSRMSLEEKVEQLTMGGAPVPDELIADGVMPEGVVANAFKGTNRGAIGNPLIPYEKISRYFEAIDAYLRTETRLGIPTIKTNECLHGVMAFGTTMFPQAVAQGATWNRELIFNMAEEIAAEAHAIGVDMATSPLFDLAREPRYGRSEECYSEDPYLAKEMGKSYVIGMQGDPEQTRIAMPEGKVACMAKHFVAYSAAAGGLNLAPAHVGERELRDIHFYPFKGAVQEANIYSLMPGYHELDGVPVHASSWLMRDILRDEWGFEGFVVSDAVAINMMEFFHKVAKDKAEAGRISINAGINMEMPGNYNYSTLVQQVREGLVSQEVVDEALRYVLTVKFKMGLFDKPAFRVPADLAQKVHTPERIDLAQKIAEESITLLKNEGNLLPLDKNKVQSIAVLGPNAHRLQLGDCSITRSPDAGITVLEGLQEYLGDSVTINYAEGCGVTSLSKDGFGAALQAAQQSDIVLLVTGGASVIYSGLPITDRETKAPATGGEGYDRSDLNFPGVQPDLIELMVKQGKPVILVNVSGRAYTMEKEAGMVSALIQAWYPGEAGGRALARIIFGEVNPSGRLPVSFPRSTGHLPVVYNDKPSSRGFYRQPGSPETPGRDYVTSSPTPLFCFGYGMSYTSFSYNDIHVENLLEEKGVVRVSFRVKNTGERDGAEVAQLYLNDVVSSVTTPRVALKNFEKVFLKAGEEKAVTLDIQEDDLMLWDIKMQRRLEAGTFKVMVGSSCENTPLSAEFEVQTDKCLPKGSSR